MRSLLLASVSVTSVVATGALLFLTGAEVAVAMVAQNAIGATTPIDGITIGIVAAGGVAGMAFMWQGGKQLVELGAFIAALRADMSEAKSYVQTLKTVGNQVDANTMATAKNATSIGRHTIAIDDLEERMAVHERWRNTIDPIVAEHGARLRGRDASDQRDTGA